MRRRWFVCDLIAIQMGRPSKICGSDAANSAMTSPHQQSQRVGPASSPGAGGYLGGTTLPHAAGSAWRPGDERLTGLQYEWTIDHFTGQVHRRSSETWSTPYSDSGTGGLLTDDAGSMEPSPKRRHSDSLASSSSPYQFSPPPSVDLPHTGARSGSSDGSQRSRQSSMSSQEAYHGGAMWGSSPTTTSNVAGPPTTTYGVLRMSGGEMLQRVTASGAGGSSVLPQPELYMHWNLPAVTATATSTTMKLSETASGDVGAFQAREMSDVIENIIRQQQQQHPTTTTHSLAAEYAGLHSVTTHGSTSSLHHHQQQHNQLAIATTGAVDSLQFFLGQSTATTVGGGGGSTQGFIPSFPAFDRPALSSLDAGTSTDASDWINHLSDDLTNDKSPATTAGNSNLLSDEGPDAEIEEQVQSTINYWLHPDLPDENVMLADRHWDVLNRVVPAYNRFVQFGTNVNRKLKIKFDVSLLLILALSIKCLVLYLILFSYFIVAVEYVTTSDRYLEISLSD